ncbi:MAG: alkaline phosphatase family protein [Verrucomicrobiaceae bacterium]|nr:alkaline phosphatase family protein [Verrucomicrobiaceae bacterium]
MSLFLAGVIFFPASLPAKPPIPTPADAPVLGDWDPYLLKQLLSGGKLGNDAGIKDIFGRDDFRALVKKHGLKLFGGPMLGDLSDVGGAVWLRTPAPARVEILIGDEVKASGNTVKSGDLATVLRFDGLKPQTEYAYDIAVDGERVFGEEGSRPRFRTFPSRVMVSRFEVCFGGGARYNHSKERIWNTIAARKPAAFLWLGDNLYIDDPKSRTRQRTYYYRRQLRPEFRRMVAASAQYSIWDDHDFGANDVSGGIAVDKPEWKLPVWRVFKENWLNPAYGGGEKHPGCWYSFNIGDVDFFMTDGRYYRDFKKAKTMLGDVQKRWLLDALKASKATFRVIASGTLWTEHADKGGADSWWGVREEREEILSLIDRENIGGVILLSADRHRTDVYQIHRPDGYTLYEFETSKLTNDHTHGTKKEALFSYNKGNYFGSLSFDLNGDDPVMTFRCITIEGREVYALPLKRSDLQK